MPRRSHGWLLVAVVLTAACGKKETPPGATPAAAPQASGPAASGPAASASAPSGVTLVSVTLGKAVGNDKKVVAATDVFAQGDTVHASVDTVGSGSATLSARWIHGRDSQRVNVAEETVSIAPTGPMTSTFRLTKPDGLRPGDYQLEIRLDDQAVVAHSFEVKAATVARRKPPALPEAKPAGSSASPGMPAASSEQLRAASLVNYGSYNCEFGQTLTLAKSRQDGYVDLRAGRHRATLQPALSSTGAVRLEEVRQGALLVVQIPSKSMLFNQKAGKRLIDDCQHARQKDQKDEAGTATRQ